MTKLKINPQIQRYIGKLVGEYEMTQFNEQVAKARLRLEEEKKPKTYDGRHEIFEKVIHLIRENENKDEIMRAVFNFQLELEESMK